MSNHISYIFICSFLLACKGKTPVERFQGNYPIKEIRYDSPRVEVILAKGAALKDLVHLNLIDTYKPGIIGVKAKKMFGEPDQEYKGSYESSYEYWSDTSKVLVHFGEDITPSLLFFLKDKNIHKILNPELVNFLTTRTQKNRSRFAISIKEVNDNSTIRLFLENNSLDYIEWTK